MEWTQPVLRSEPQMINYDVIVIGGGAGLNIARKASSNGLKTAFIEKDRLGGTCLNRGCIPSKMLIYPAEAADKMRRSTILDIQADTPVSVDFKNLMNRINNTASKISDEILDTVKNHENIDFYHDQAGFTANKVLRVENREITADKIFIGTGAKPFIPDIKGLKDIDYMTSTEALRCDVLPESMIVIGAGYVAAELGYAYSACGCKVDFVVRSSFLRKEDHDISDVFQKVFIKNHSVHQGWIPVEAGKKDGLFKLVCKNRKGDLKTYSAEALLVASGVVPETDRLGLENTDIKLTKGGYIEVDDYLRTGAPGVYAFGDVVGNYLFRHTANFEARYISKVHISGEDLVPLDYGPVPHAVFSYPEIAGVGLTENEAIDEGIDYVVGTAEYSESTPGLARCSDHGLVKLIFSRQTRKLLGAHIVGDDAATMLHMFIVLMKYNGTLDDLLDMIFIHPALPEVARDAVLHADRLLC